MTANINDMGVPTAGGQSFMQISSGKLVSIQKPQPEDIAIRDIVNSLTKQCRYNGHTSRFYSVAEHTIQGDWFLVNYFKSSYASKDGYTNLRKAWLVHDFTEAYVGDLIRPIKRHNPSFQELEEVFQRVIEKAFGPYETDHNMVKFVDNIMCMWEKRDLLHNTVEWPGMPNIEPFNLPELPSRTFEQAEEDLTRLFEELFNEKG